MQLEIVHPLRDARVLPLVEAAFQRAGRETRLVEELARACPEFDPGLSLLAIDDGVPAGYALFVPRSMRVRGAWVKLAIAGPICVHPARRRRGVGRFLLETGLGALADRGIRGAVMIGANELYGALGFESAWNAYVFRAPATALAGGDDASSWRGLAERDLAPLVRLQQHAYADARTADVDGTELRHAAPIDWESAAPRAHTLVRERDGELEAYVRFRVRGELEVSECGARDARGVASILAFLRRLLGEHGRSRVDVHVPPPHAVARELFHRGALCETNQLGGSARLRVTDWPGLLADTAASWRSALESARVRSANVELGGATRRFELGAAAHGNEEVRVATPAGWGSSLLVGQRDHLDLARERGTIASGAVARLERALFPGGTPLWTYSPVFELADE